MAESGFQNMIIIPASRYELRAIFALSEGQDGSHPPNEFISVSHSEGYRPGHLRRTRGAGTEGHRSASTPR